MSKKIIVYSKLAADQLYIAFHEVSKTGSKQNNAAGEVPKVRSEILIKGGADVMNARTLITPRGTATVITEEQLADLRNNPVFKQHHANGFLHIEEAGEVSLDVDTRVVEMLGEKKDNAAPLTAEQSTKRSRPDAPKVHKNDDKE